MEQFVDGIEVEVGVLGNRTPVASLPGEIVVTRNEWYDYEAKYDEGEMDLVVPARVVGRAARARPGARGATRSSPRTARAWPASTCSCATTARCS